MTRGPSTDPNCPSSLTTVNGAAVCQGKLIFDDTFDTFSDNWKKEVRFAGPPDYEFVLYTNDRKNVDVSNGNLQIKPLVADDERGQGFVNLPGGLNLGARFAGVNEAGS